jgi:tetratricopeptide (TPR) repeat protein
VKLKACRSRIGAIFVLALLMSIAPAHLLAQTTDQRIQYSEILADPDNIELSVKYAQQLINDGEFQKATISLERILLLNPEIDKARLLIALVYFRLGSFAEAESELNFLKARKLGIEDSIVVEKYLDLIYEKRKLWSASSIFSLGLHYDTNKNSNPESSQIRAIDLFFDNTGTDEDDVGLLSVIGFEYKTKLNAVDPIEVFFSSAFVYDNQEKLNNIDTVAMAPKFGVKTIWRTFDLSSTIGLTNVRVDDVEFMNIYDLKLRGSRTFDYQSNQFNIYSEFSTAFEDFQNTARTTTGNENDGYSFGLKTGLSIPLTPDIQFGSDAKVSRKYADIDFNSSTQFGYGASFTMPLNSTAIANLNLNLDYKFFDDPDPFVSSTKERSDVTYSSGLNILFQMDKILEDIQWPDHQTFSSGLLGTIGVNYKRTESNLENFEFENTTFQISITKQIAF